MGRDLSVYNCDMIIKGRVWKIYTEPKLSDGAMGWCYPKDRLIFISAAQSKDEMFKTLIHELLHAFERDWHANFYHPTIYRLEAPMADLLKNNINQLVSIVKTF